MTNIPLVDLRAQYGPLKEEIMAALGDVLDGMKLFLGENVFELEREFAALCRAKHAVGVGSGTDALYLALRAVGVGPGDEVITAPNSFIATAGAIAMTGATPKFADILPDTHTIDPAAIEAAITPRTKAIIPVHLYGQAADMGAIGAIAAKHKLAVIEDACQAHGAEYEGQRMGTFGDAAAFSFYYSKNLGAYGEAGIVVSNSRSVATQIQLLRNHGSTSRYHHSVLGMNSRLDEMQATVLRIKLRYLEEANSRRRLLASEYNRRLAEIPDVVRPVERIGSMHVYHLYVIRVPQRNELLEWLNSRGVGAAIHYPKPIHLQEATRHLGHREGDFPVAEQAANEILSLPIYPELTIDDVDFVVQSIADFMKAKRGSKRTEPAGSPGGVVQ
jgi:dTDP-4-amino-4,6-dideoxygalactose transaminase